MAQTHTQYYAVKKSYYYYHYFVVLCAAVVVTIIIIITKHIPYRGQRGPRSELYTTFTVLENTVKLKPV